MSAADFSDDISLSLSLSLSLARTHARTYTHTPTHRLELGSELAGHGDNVTASHGFFLYHLHIVPGAARLEDETTILPAVNVLITR